MLTENEIKRIYESIDDLDDQYKKLFESLAVIKMTVESLSVDNRSINTAIQNMAMSFGVLKEKTDAIVTSLKSISEHKDNSLESVLRDTDTRFTDFRSFCDSRASSVDLKLSILRTYTDAEIGKIVARSESNSKELASMKTKVSAGLFIVGSNLVALIIWLVKLLGVSYGWWT